MSRPDLPGVVAAPDHAVRDVTAPDPSGCATTGDTAAALLATALPRPGTSALRRRDHRRAALTVLGDAPRLHGETTEMLVSLARIALHSRPPGGEG
jgi:hypothetical protein